MQTGTQIPIKGFLETSLSDWAGKICSVVFFPQCNFRCRYCHNAALVLEPESLATFDFNAILQYLKEHRQWIDGVCVTGGEPTLQESLPLVLRALKEQGFATKLDTNGSNPNVLRSLIMDGLIDYIAMDIKASLDEKSYCKITGAADMLGLVRQSIRTIIDSDIEHEFRCTVLPSCHHPDDIMTIARQLYGAQRLRLQNFNPRETLDPDFAQMQPYSDDMIHGLQQQVDAMLCGRPAGQYHGGFSGTA